MRPAIQFSLPPWSLPRPPRCPRAAVAAAKSTASMMTMNNVQYRFAHLTTNPAYKRMPARLRMNIQNTCTLLRLLDAHLLPEYLYIVAVGRTAAIPFRLAGRQHHQSDLRQPQAANAVGRRCRRPRTRKKWCQAPSSGQLDSSRRASRRVEAEGDGSAPNDVYRPR